MSLAIKVPDVPAPKDRLCWKQNVLMHRCDRRADHLGPHTWEFPTWQAIDTAPKDGRRILLLDHYGECRVACWSREIDGDHWCQSAALLGGACYVIKPSAWCALPPPPTEPQET